MNKIKPIVNKYKFELEQAVPSRAYKIVEDFCMLIGMSEYDHWVETNKPGWGPKFWVQWAFKGEIDRPLESLRDRYKRFVRNLSRKDIEMIFRWIEKNSTANAFLHFTGPNNKNRGDRLFSHVSREDPMTTKK